METEPGDLMASLQCGPVQCFKHAVDTRGVSIILVSTKRAAARRCTADVFLSVGVPRVTQSLPKELLGGGKHGPAVTVYSLGSFDRIV